jgi:hypothetical protein
MLLVAIQTINAQIDSSLIKELNKYVDSIEHKYFYKLEISEPVVFGLISARIEISKNPNYSLQKSLEQELNEYHFIDLSETLADKVKSNSNIYGITVYILDQAFILIDNKIIESKTNDKFKYLIEEVGLFLDSHCYFPGDNNYYYITKCLSNGESDVGFIIIVLNKE